MYKIMLVEDEPEVLHAMTAMPNWNGLGFQTPIACANGQQAIDAIENGFVPHAVITDICMPFVDGVSLAAYLGQHCPSALVVILSGYDDFSYAQKAIQLKVYDYILKPITPKSLMQLAQRLRETLDERRLKNADEFDTLARERFLTQLLTAPLEPQYVCDSLRVHKIEACGGSWLALAVDLTLPAAETAEQSRSNELLRYGLANIVTELAQTMPSLVFCGTVKQTCALILHGADADILEAYAQELAARVSEACKILGENATTGVGTVVQNADALHVSYEQATLALHYRFFFGHVPCILSREVALQPTGRLDYAALEAQFTQAVKRGSRADGQAALCSLCDTLQAQKVPYEQCLRYSQRMMLHLVDLMGEYVSAEELARLEHTWEQTRLFKAETLQQLQAMLQQVCDLAFDSFERAGEDDAALRVRKAETYIRSHYSDETLSLNTMKDVFCISVSYFSAIFKTHTGSTFVEYLTQTRIDKAKELLSLTEKRAGEIAQEVGFADPHYFSITFKRVTGLTPREYRMHSREGCAQGDVV